jgi:GDP-L-fucose synthase
MNAIITGYTGYLGKALTKFLEKQGWKVFGINSRYGNLWDHTPDELAGLCADDPYFVLPSEVDVIFHLAAYTKAGDWCLTHKAEQFEINQKINTNILDFWGCKCPQAKMIAMGTSCSYDPTLPLSEENYLKGCPDEGLSTYAYTKRMLLVGLKSYAEQYNLKYTYLIPSTIYGPGFVESDTHFIFDLIKKIYYAKNTGEEISLWGNGQQRRELIYIDDVIKSIYNLLHVDNKIFNIGYGYEYSIKEYARFICNQLDYDINKIVWDTTKYVGVQSKLLEIDNIKKEISDYKIGLTGLSDGLIKTIEYYKELKNVRT